MKLNLGCGQDIRHNYINVDREAVPNLPDTLFRQGDIRDLDWLCGDEYVEEILALNVLQCFNIDDLPQILEGWRRKLIDNGIIKISICDAQSLMIDFNRGNLNVLNLNSIIFGNKHENLCTMDFYHLQNILREGKLQILTSKFNDSEFYTEAQKC